MPVPAGETAPPRDVALVRGSHGQTSMRDGASGALVASLRHVAIRAVVFDIGGVLERVGPPVWAEAWRRRLGLTQSEFDAALARVDPDGLAQTGGFSEAEMRSSYAGALRLSDTQVDELMADIWDWYCGELDEPLASYVRGLRERVRTGIVSNSADGARREESRRYGFPDLIDDIVYSHEVGLAKPDPAIFALACTRLGVQPSETVFVDDVVANVAGAACSGLHAVRHESTPDTIAAIDALLESQEGLVRRVCREAMSDSQLPSPRRGGPKGVDARPGRHRPT